MVSQSQFVSPHDDLIIAKFDKLDPHFYMQLPTRLLLTEKCHSL